MPRWLKAHRKPLLILLPILVLVGAAAVFSAREAQSAGGPAAPRRLSFPRASAAARRTPFASGARALCGPGIRTGAQAVGPLVQGAGTRHAPGAKRARRRALPARPVLVKFNRMLVNPEVVVMKN